MISVAILGGGLNSAVGRAHLAALAMDRKYRVHAGCFSTDPLVNLATGESIGLPPTQIFSSAEEMADALAHDVEAVVILTPTNLHHEHVKLMSKRSHFVICEKALDTSPRAAMELLGTDSQGRILVTYNYSAYPMVREVRRRLQEGDFGELLSMRIEMPQEGFIKLGENSALPSVQSWRQHDASISMVSLDLGTHLMQLIRMLTGQSMTRCVAQSDHQGLVADVVDHVDFLAEYESGLRVRGHYGKTTLGQRNGLAFQIDGTLGSVAWHQGVPGQLYVASARGELQVVDHGSPSLREANKDRYTRFKAGHPYGFVEAYANMYWDFRSWIRREGGVVNDDLLRSYGSGEAIRGLIELESIELAARSREWVSVSQSLEAPRAV